jgi:hypothetical protein
MGSAARIFVAVLSRTSRKVKLEFLPARCQSRDIANPLVVDELNEPELKARRTLRDRVMKALPARKAIRYLQLESKIRAAQDYDLATTIPLLKQ